MDKSTFWKIVDSLYEQRLTFEQRQTLNLLISDHEKAEIMELRAQLDES